VVTTADHDPPDGGTGRVLGWLSGFGLVFFPWVAAGVVSTFLPEPETAFPLVLAGAFAVMVVWIVYGVFRIPRFARGALIGAGIVLGVLAALLLAVAAFR